MNESKIVCKCNAMQSEKKWNISGIQAFECIGNKTKKKKKWTEEYKWKKSSNK